MTQHEALRKLPKIDDLVRHPTLAALEVPRWAVVEASRRQVAAVRRDIMAGTPREVLVEDVARLAQELRAPSLRKVVNATGVVLHTNLGRAPLSHRAIQAVADVASGYCNLEYDVDAGRRGSRHGHVKELLCDLTGAEDALVVNNCAAAVMLGLGTFAAGKKVIVSRGELVEIGGSFRIPDIMKLSGAELVEVGTTNKTRIADYETALDDDVALLLKVHRSNFEIVGFTEEATLEEIASLGRAHGVRTMMDLGSGALVGQGFFRRAGLAEERGVRGAVSSGVDVVAFSGDKLLGGPQAGILVGTKEQVARLRKHPFTRALRPDKMTIAALVATLESYRDGAFEEIPALAALSAEIDALRTRAASLAAHVESQGGAMRVVELTSTVGGGTMPRAELASVGLEVPGSAEAADKRLRALKVPVVGRVWGDRLVLDLRTVAVEDDGLIVAAVNSVGTQ